MQDFTPRYQHFQGVHAPGPPPPPSMTGAPPSHINDIVLSDWATKEQPRKNRLEPKTQLYKVEWGPVIYEKNNRRTTYKDRFATPNQIWYIILKSSYGIDGVYYIPK